MKMKYVWIALAALILIGIGVYYFFNSNDSEKFSVFPSYFKIVVNTNGSSEGNFKIINSYSKEQDFLIRVNGFNELVKADKSSLKIGSKGEEDIVLFFNSNGKIPGAYFGELVAESNYETKKIPLVFIIQSSDLLFYGNVNIYLLNKDAVPGQKINADIKLYDLAEIGKSNIQVDYSIKDLDGNLIFSESETKIVDSGKLEYSKVFEIPYDAKYGNYILLVSVRYKNSLGISGNIFKVAKESGKGTDANLTWIILIFVFFFLLFLILFIYSMFYRDRMLQDLERQYRGEIRRQNMIIKMRERRVCATIKNKKQRKIYVRAIRKIRKKRIRAIKEIHRQRIKEYRKIKKQGDKKKLIHQINQWKKKGFETGFLEKKYKIPEIRTAKKKISEWKKKGFNTDVLER